MGEPRCAGERAGFVRLRRCPLASARVEAVGLALRLRALEGLAQFKNPAAPAVKREAEEDWGRGGGGDDANARAIPIRAKHVVQRS